MEKSNYIGEALLSICYNRGMKVIPREAQLVATNSTAIRKLRTSLSLNQTQRFVLIGSLLGDGCLVPNSWKKHYRLFITQSEKQRDYLNWKYKIFENFVLSKPKYHEKTKSCRFRTISHLGFTEYRKIFYPFDKKIVPEEIEKLLIHPISLAVWYMDDGSLHTRKNTFVLNTQSFSFEENEKLQKCLLKNFGIESSINRDKKYWRLYIKQKSAKRFNVLIKEYVATLMNYKLL